MASMRPLSLKSISDLLSSYFVYQVCSNKFAMKYGPRFFVHSLGSFYKYPILWFTKQTFYRQFCGGEDVNEIKKIIRTLGKGGNLGILHYAVENEPDKSGNSTIFLENLKKDQETVKIASEFYGTRCAIKLTSFIPYDLLKKISQDIIANEHKYSELLFAENYPSKLLPEFDTHWQSLNQLVEYAFQNNVTIAVDAEYLEIQPAIDFLTLKLMSSYNKNDHIIISNTYQMYLQGCLERMKSHFDIAQKMKFSIGLKLVRGAYLQYDQGKKCGSLYGPILGSAQETHNQYNQALKYMLHQKNHQYPNFDLIVATHNRDSVKLAFDIIGKDKSMYQRVSFAQLYGMADDLSQLVLDMGGANYKYLPYGPVNLVMPYLIRRAEENSDVLKAGNELKHITDELKTRLFHRSITISHNAKNT